MWAWMMSGWMVVMVVGADVEVSSVSCGRGGEVEDMVFGGK